MQYDPLKDHEQPVLTASAAYLTKWLRVLFGWIVIMAAVTAVFSSDWLQRFRDADLMELAVRLLAIGGLVFLYCKLGKAASGYRMVMLCWVVSLGTELALFSVRNNGPTWYVMTGVECVVFLVMMYQKCHAHAEILKSVDRGLADKWLRLWKWTWSLLAGLLGCIPVALISSILAVILLIGVVVGIVVVNVLDLIYLWQTGTAFRGCVSAEPEAMSEPKDT